MRSLGLGQSLAVAVALSLTLLLIGVLTLGAIRLGVVVPPDLDIWLGGIHIVASIDTRYRIRGKHDGSTPPHEHALLLSWFMCSLSVRLRSSASQSLH